MIRNHAHSDLQPVAIGKCNVIGCDCNLLQHQSPDVSCIQFMTVHFSLAFNPFRLLSPAACLTSFSLNDNPSLFHVTFSLSEDDIANIYVMSRKINQTIDIHQVVASAFSISYKVSIHNIGSLFTFNLLNNIEAQPLIARMKEEKNTVRMSFYVHSKFECWCYNECIEAREKYGERERARGDVYSS